MKYFPIILKQPLSVYFKKISIFLLLFLVHFYRTFLSSHFGGACRFSPSCSEYAVQILSKGKKSLFQNLCLILSRLSKCRFFGPFGIDDPDLIFHKKRKT